MEKVAVSIDVRWVWKIAINLKEQAGIFFFLALLSGFGIYLPWIFRFFTPLFGGGATTRLLHPLRRLETQQPKVEPIHLSLVP